VVRLRLAGFLAGISGAGLMKRPAQSGDYFTDDNGTVTMEGIDTGAFCVEVSDTAYAGGPVAALLRITLAGPDTTAAFGDVPLTQCASLAGYVDRSVVGSGTDVGIRIRGLERVTTASSTGSYTLDNIPAGGPLTVHYSVSGSEYLSVEHSVILAPGEARHLATVMPGSSFSPDLQAVRAILDSNGLFAVPADSVATVIDGRVDALWLDSLGLTVIPADVGNLTRLRTLSAQANLLTAAPGALGNCASLEEIFLESNALAALPAAIFSLPELRIISVAANAIDSLPSNIGDCVTLDKLSIADNRIRDLPASICELTKMREFFAEKNLLDSVPACIGGFKGLISCNLHDNNLSALPDGIMSIPFLSHLRVDNNRLCTIDTVMGAWLDGLNPGWDTAQVCP
jgi:hypothetical protein